MKNNFLHGLWHGRLETPGQLHIQFMVQFCVKLTVSQWTVLPPEPHLLVLFSAIPCYSVTRFFLYAIDFTQKTYKSIIEVKFFHGEVWQLGKGQVLLEKHIVWMSLLKESVVKQLILALHYLYASEITADWKKASSRWRNSWSAQTYALGHGSKSSEKLFPGRTGRWIGIASIDLSQANHVWPAWLPCDGMTGSGWGESSGCHFPWLYQGCHHSLPCRAGLTLRGTSTNTENGSTETTWSSNGKFYTWYKITSWMSTGWALTTWTAAPMKRTWGSWWVTNWTWASSMSLQ